MVVVDLIGLLVVIVVGLIGLVVIHVVVNHVDLIAEGGVLCIGLAVTAKHSSQGSCNTLHGQIAIAHSFDLWMCPPRHPRSRQEMPSCKQRWDVNLQVLELLQHGGVSHQVGLQLFLAFSLKLLKELLAPFW